MLIINSIIFVKKIRLSLVCCASHHCYFVSLQHFPPPLPSKTPPPPPPKTTRKQASIDSGIVQWTKRLRVGPNNTDNTTKVYPEQRLLLPTHSSLPIPAWQDEYLTAAPSLLSSSFCLWTPSLKTNAICSRECVTQMSSHWTCSHHYTWHEIVLG